jgi:5'-3' exonuclease
MGIPFYFASLVRKHKRILRALTKEDKCTNLCLDSNSIVYDVVRSMKYDPNDATFEQRLCVAVCAKLESYLQKVQPTRVYIAFDGPPPMAKMKQQKERRYKGKVDTSQGWDTVQITPGTTFMLQLDAALTAYFHDHPTKYDFFKLSTSAEAGEGEHKIFEWIRSAQPTGTTFVYGLDSDLIILALHHLKYGEIYMMREFKEELKLLDVPKLATQIETVVGAGNLYDYIFMVFFVGNDFLPHFPALNLRTRGLDTLLQTYAQLKKPLYDGTNILWENVQLFLNLLAAREGRDLCREYTERGKKPTEDTPENIPLLRREIEQYINPTEAGWEHRYYVVLLKMEPSGAPKVCREFFRTLEWNVKYYTTACPSWDVYYPHMYPPLLKDLARHVPLNGTGAFDESKPKSSTELLAFVLPPAAHMYSPTPLVETKVAPELYWAFCTFLWEGHLFF